MIQPTKRKLRRQVRIRSNVRGTTERPRLSVYRSNTAMAAQIIDDSKHITLIGITQAKDTSKKSTGTKTEKAKELGLALAKQALEKKIKTVVFDKGSYAYHGRVKAVAEGAREGGLSF